MTGYAIVADDGFQAKTIIGALMNYTKDTRALKFQVPLSFQRYNWLKEPNESLESMYLTMARRIGQKAQGRIILGYTGGTDSATAAYYFAKAGVDIEYLHYSQPLKKTLFDADVHIDAKIKELEELHKKFNRPKPIVHVKPGSYYIKQYNDYIFSQPHFYDNNEIAHINRNYMGTSSELYRDMEEFANDTLVVGLEKPKLHMDEVGIYWQKESEMYTILLGERSYKRIAFYADQSAPHIFAKQAHEVLKYILHGNPTRAEIGRRLHVLQYEAKYYHTWSSLMGRITDEKRSLLTYLTKPNTSVPYGFSYRHQNAYKEFISNRLTEHTPHESKAFKDVLGYLNSLASVNPLSDKFYVHRFSV